MIDRSLRAAGMQEVRENLRSLLGVLDGGSPVAILQHGEIVAVMLLEDEIERFRYAELGLSTLHGTGIYPEAVRDTSELAGLFARGAPSIHPAAVIEIANRPREILAGRSTTNASEFRHSLTHYIAEIRDGQPTTIVREGRFAYGVVSAREFDRLTNLHRIMRWFDAAGLDLANATAREVIEFVREFRARSAEAEASATSSALGEDAAPPMKGSAIA
jgi:prevent-host-death family protein